MMAGNPSWWAMFPPYNSFADHQPQSWSQLLLGEEDRVLNQQTQMSHYHHQPKKLENWEDHQILSNNNFVDVVKQEANSNIRDHQSLIQDHIQAAASSTTLSTTSHHHHTNKFLNFSCDTNNNPHHNNNNNQAASGGGGGHDHSPEFNHSVVVTSGACKKARVHPPSSSQPPLKVRKEKLVDRITTLHQIVSPFGKTDTASVLSEAIGYIRFLQGQIEALSYPYLRSAPKDLRNSQPAPLLNDSCLKRKVTPNQGEEMMNGEEIMKPPLKDLRSKGLCLVPISCTHLVGSDNNNNGAAYWSAAYGTTGYQ